MENEKKSLVTVEDIKGRIGEIDKELQSVADREYRDGYLPDRLYLAELRDEKATLQEVLDILGKYSLEDIQKELDARDPIAEELADDGIGSVSFYVLAHAEKVLQHSDVELQARVDFGERVIEQWENTFKNLSWDETEAVYGIIRDMDVPFERLEESIRKCLVRMNEDLQDDLCDIGGRRCLKVDEWKDGEDVFVLGNAVSEGEFYYSSVNGKISNCFEYDFRPSREQVEYDWLNEQTERAINEHEAEFGADGRRAFPGDNSDSEGNPEFYEMFYAGEQDEEAFAFQKETGWHMIWGSDYQGFNGDTWVVYRDVEDLPKWMRNYAWKEERIDARKAEMDKQVVGMGRFGSGEADRSDVGIEVLFTFGSWEKYPFQMGYVSITAPSLKMAIEEFRRNYPDVNEGILNCADYYYDEASVASIKERGNGAGCHRAIVVSSRDMSVDELIADGINRAIEGASNGKERDLEY